ncbi:MAG: glycosyltransferase family 1 protein [Leptolyngbya sp.]|nr:MAG: glycosyltransferase family 1 protein [Leptolyngbya sp.]
MHIIALSSYLSSKRGGLEHSLFDVCQALVERGYQITLVYEEEGDQLEKYQQFCTALIKITSYKLNSRFLSDVRKITNVQNSIIYSNQYDNFFFGRVLSQLQGIPLVCHLRLHASTEDSYLKRLKQSLTLLGISHYIAISEAVKTDWCDRLNIRRDKVSIVYNGIEPERFAIADDISDLRKAWDISSEERVISYVGRLETEKGIETLIRAFALLRQSSIPAKLLIAGKSLFSGEGYISQLEALTDDLNIKDDVRFLGHLSNTKSLYQVSDVTVLPSLWLEAFGRVIIEAMACGTPALGSRSGGIPEILTGEFSDWLFTPGDEIDLHTKLKAVLHWRNTDPILPQRCRQHVINNFSLNQTINGIEAVLQEALNQ